MPTREEKIAFIQSQMASKAGNAPAQGPSREEKIAFIQSQIQKQNEPEEKPREESLGRRLTRSAIDTVLPIGGAITAGALATPESFGIATVPAGAAGYAAGKQAARILNHYLLGDDGGASGAGNLVKQTAGDLGEGALNEILGLGTGKVIEAAAPYAAPIVKPIAEKIGKGIEYAGGKIGGAAEKAAAKAVGAGAKEFENKVAAKAIGRNALDQKIIGPFTSAEESLARATKAKEAAGTRMEDVFQEVDKTIGPSVNPLNAAVRVEKELAPTYRTPINKSEVGQLENTIESILARGNSNISLEEAQSLKKEIDSVAFPKGKKPLDPTPKQVMAQDASRIIKDEIDQAASKGAEALGSKDILEKLSEARKTFGTSRQAEKLLTKQAGKEEVNVGTKINWTVDPVKFGASVVKKVGPNTQATKAIALDSVASILKKTPKVFGEFSEALSNAQKAGPQHLAAMHMMLEQTNPQYQQLIQKVAGAEPEKPKGSQKWAADGFEKLLQHTDEAQMKSQLNEIKEKLMSDPKLKGLLIRASDLKPGTKAMDDVMKKLKSRVSERGE